MKRHHLMILLITMISALLLPVSCTGRSEDQKAAMGNSNDNIANLGYAAALDEWIYFRNEADHASLHRIRTDGSETAKLNEDRPIFLNALAGWIYYMDLDEPGEEQIIRIRPDGSERTLITEIPAYYMRIAGEWIYYINLTGQAEDPDTNRLFRMKLDGSDPQKITDRPTWFFAVAGPSIYYLDTAEGVIRKVNADGTGEESISAQRVRRFAVDEQYIYYLKGPELTAGIWRMKLDGTEPEQLSEDLTQGLNLHNGWLYYARTDPADAANRRLKRMRSDGSDPQELTDDEHALEISVIGDWIFYAGPDVKGYRKATLLRIDGTDRKDYSAQ